jgi:hypothetical protein
MGKGMTIQCKTHYDFARAVFIFYYCIFVIPSLDFHEFTPSAVIVLKSILELLHLWMSSIEGTIRLQVYQVVAAFTSHTDTVVSLTAVQALTSGTILFTFFITFFFIILLFLECDAVLNSDFRSHE